MTPNNQSNLDLSITLINGSLPYGGTRTSQATHELIRKLTDPIRFFFESLVPVGENTYYRIKIQPNMEWEAKVSAWRDVLIALAKLPNIPWIVDTEMDWFVKVRGKDTTVLEILYERTPPNHLSEEPYNERS